MGSTARKLSSLHNLHLSHKEADVRVERQFRFEFAKPKARRRLPAGVAPQTPTSFLSRDIPAISPDIGFDPGDDIVQQVVPRDSGRHLSHRDESVAGGDDRVHRRPVTRDALRAREDKVLRNRSSAERHGEVAYRFSDALDDLKNVMRRLPRFEDYRSLSEQLLAVEQANESLQAMVECLAPLETKVVALRAQNQLLVQLLGIRGPVGSAPDPGTA
ncbi:uncharacterized protein PHALS_06454 [Plasmopara halstedii]|uniref:Uncharacterized protein n=1 Tax=Plasmopara halstedii TaxID=4781 RepID=A0A0P1B2G9_PLAHL|nr:uncharacterized protein PHALS_06454 [Plasmopara halstedii]CEG48642.1 hypothetical protein PHALS_06454 [Plasmopara halstedii]|eukprot:XP_024585011.1 hypothetical protein PHALS_06454 [Plasmopara halstedii]